ncbi:MAG: ECF transporter S component [Ruminococcaceae bacterium]|nr:ECF transporter S component [Oscillospiraceae bacterium]
MKQGKRMSTETIVLGAVLTALVIVLQLAGAFIRFGPFSISLVLIPIVIGAATCGVWVSSWLGFVFGIAVLLSGDAAAFLAIDVPGTIITVLAKGIGCGFAAGFVYNMLLEFLDKRSKNVVDRMKSNQQLCSSCERGVLKYISRNNKYIAVLAAAIACPIANTGIFLIGCAVFFLDTLAVWSGGGSVLYYMIFGLVGANFLFELGSNIILSPVVVRLLNIKAKNQ